MPEVPKQWPSVQPQGPEMIPGNGSLVDWKCLPVDFPGAISSTGILGIDVIDL